MTTCLFHLSDVHFGVENKRALEAVSQAVLTERPDAVVCTGDLTQRAKHSEYAAAARWFEGLGVPVVLDPGNHDMPYYNLIERFFDPYRRYRKLARALPQKLESEDIILVPLKTTVRAQPRFPWSDGFVTGSALRKTLDQLRALEGDPRTKIVTAHHPLLGPEGQSRNPTIGGNQAFEAVAAAGADAVISGHVHRPFDELRKSGDQILRMIGVGTLSTRLRHGAPPCYRVLKCGADGLISTELRNL